MARWVNYFVHSKKAFGTEGHLAAEELRAKIEAHHGGEAFHCAYDLIDEKLKLEEDTGVPKADGKGTIKKYHDQSEELLKKFPKTVTEYTGEMRPAMGYVWFDFDSSDSGVEAWADVCKFKDWLGVKGFGCYSGSKGFHYGVPFSCFGLAADEKLGEKLNALATKLKKTYKSIDTTVFNANRKFRALGTKHPSTSLYKIWLGDVPTGQPLTLELIKLTARGRGSLKIPEPITYEPLAQLRELLKAPTPDNKDSISLAELRRYRQPNGEAAFIKCGFLKHCKENPNNVHEPEWYALASIVGRFKDGQAQFHAVSKGHAKYNATETDEKLQQALQVSGPRTCEAIGKLFDCSSCELYQKIKSPIVILEDDVIPTEATGFYDLIPSKTTDEIKRIPNYGDLLRRFITDRPYKCIADMKAVYTFQGTHYVEYTPIEIKAFAEDKFEPKPNEKLRQEFCHKVFANHVARRSFFFDGIQDRINFANGVLEIETGALEAHSPDFGFRNVLPYSYEPGAKCPTFDWWIKDVMLGDEQLVAILQEFMGYVVSGGEYSFHKALWLSGSGRNGKSTFLSVLKALIGNGNYSTLSIRQIINDKFSSADLDGKIANFSEETSPEELSDSGPFKNLTGDGELLAQKKYGDPYSFRNRAKLIMTYNEVPQLKDLSPGMLSRPIIVPWKKDLSAIGAQDRNLKSKLLAELPGIFNFALRGWQRLEEQEDFTQSPKSQIEMEEMRQASCSVASWVAETITFAGADVEITKPRQLYEAYRLAVGQYAYAEQKFYKRLNAIPNVAKRRMRTERGTEYSGMKFRRSTSAVIDF